MYTDKFRSIEFYKIFKDELTSCLWCFRYTALQVIDLIQTEDEEELASSVDIHAKSIDIALGIPDEGDTTDEDSDKEEQPDVCPSRLGRKTLKERVAVSGMKLKPQTSEDEPKRKKKKIENFEWKKSDFQPTFLLPTPSLSLTEEAENDLALCQKPIDFFFLLFDEDIQNHIVSESNIYAEKKGVSLNLT